MAGVLAGHGDARDACAAVVGLARRDGPDEDDVTAVLVRRRPASDARGLP